MTGVDLDVNIARVTTAKLRNESDMEITHWQ